jgi:mRNA-degrading endonuclease RelE of RelBE toxin-antitoxin system
VSATRNHLRHGNQSQEHRVELAPEAARVFRNLPHADTRRLRMVLRKLAIRAAQGGLAAEPWLTVVPEPPGASPGRFVVLRLGHVRLICDVIGSDRVVLVLAIVKRWQLRRAALGQASALRHAARGRRVDWRL